MHGASRIKYAQSMYDVTHLMVQAGRPHAGRALPPHLLTLFRLLVFLHYLTLPNTGTSPLPSMNVSRIRQQPSAVMFRRIVRSSISEIQDARSSTSFS